MKGERPPKWLEGTDKLVIGGIGATLVVALMVLINIQVALSAMGRGVSIPLGGDVALIGNRITINSLIDAQWHLLLIVSLLPMGLLLMRNIHIRVDFFYEAMPPRARALVDIVGHILLAAPFLWLSIPAAWRFAASAWRNDEGSPLGGLQDLYLIKSVLFIGLCLLAVFVVLDVGRKIVGLFGRGND